MKAKRIFVVVCLIACTACGGGGNGSGGGGANDGGPVGGNPGGVPVGHGGKVSENELLNGLEEISKDAKAPPAPALAPPKNPTVTPKGGDGDKADGPDKVAETKTFEEEFKATTTPPTHFSSPGYQKLLDEFGGRLIVRRDARPTVVDQLSAVLSESLYSVPNPNPSHVR